VPSLGLGLTSAPVFQQGYGPAALGAPYQRQGQEPGQGDFRRDFLQQNNAKQLEEAESADPNAVIHGNWTMESAKSFLHQFMQTRHIKADYTYSVMGRSFVAEMRFYVNELRREVVGRETASNKQSASKSCALPLSQARASASSFSSWASSPKLSPGAPS
jgi:ATP-dependent RNA helicase A